MSDNCKHPTCYDSPHCRREKKPKKIYQLKRTAIKKKAYKIRPFSLKRQEINQEYSKESKAFLAKHPYCQIQIKGVCTFKAQGIHHVRGRSTIELLMNKSWWKSSCNSCNLWVEDNSKQAKELGHKKSKHDVNQQAKLPGSYGEAKDLHQGKRWKGFDRNDGKGFVHFEA